ncbi:unnamed protein product, partial [Bubo scandiacus]
RHLMGLSHPNISGVLALGTLATRAPLCHLPQQLSGYMGMGSSEVMDGFHLLSPMV